VLPRQAKRWVIDVFGHGSQIAWAQCLRLAREPLREELEGAGGVDLRGHRAFG
jgi:hypothetical protein